MPENCPDSAKTCPFRARIEALEQEIVHNKDAHKEFYNRLDASHTSVAVIEERLNQIKEDTEEIKASLQAEKSAVQELRDKPGKRWEGIVDKAIWAEELALDKDLLDDLLALQGGLDCRLLLGGGGDRLDAEGGGAVSAFNFIPVAPSPFAPGVHFRHNGHILCKGTCAQRNNSAAF